MQVLALLALHRSNSYKSQLAVTAFILSKKHRTDFLYDVFYCPYPTSDNSQPVP